MELLYKLGFIDTEDEKQLKPTYKHSLVNLTHQNDILYTNSHHSKQLQKSDYLVIEASEKRLQNLADMQVQHQS